MKLVSRVLAPTSLLALLASVAVGQVTRTPAGYLLRVKYAKGQALKFASVNTVSGATGQPGAGLKIAMPIVLRVTDVQGPFAIVRATIGPAYSGKNVVYQQQSALLRLNNRNQDADGQSSSVGAQLPEKPLKIGSTWSSNAPLASGMGGAQNLNASYRFAGVKTVKGKGVAVITYSIKGAAVGTGRLTLLVKDGTLFTNEMKISLSSMGTAPITLTSSMQRQ